LTSYLDDTYAYDANGNVLSITDAAQAGLTTRSMTYDALDRMLTANSALQWGNGTYDYDPLDNLRQADQSATARTFRYNYDAATNRLSTIKSSAGATLYTFGYDVRGNTTAKNAQHFVFDTANRMSTADLTAGGGTQTYRYDGLGRRVQTTDPGASSPPMEFWVYSQAGQVLYTSEARRSRNLSYIYLNGSQVATRAYAWGTGAITTRFQMTDALGSPVANTDTSGGTIQRTSYGPWGEATPSVDGTGYTGHVMDSGTGLTYMQQRYFDPTAGRFASSDPVTTYEKPLTNFNRYSYAFGNPYRFADPDGRDAMDWVHGGLTAASFCPSVCGSAFSAIDGAVSLAEGDKTGAAISFGAAAAGLVSDAGAAKLLAMGARETAAASKFEGAVKLFHYTDEAGAKAIKESGKILANEKGQVFLTAERLSKGEVQNALFIGNAGTKGSHVVEVELKSGAVVKQGKNAKELIHQGTIRDGRQASLEVRENDF